MEDGRDPSATSEATPDDVPSQVLRAALSGRLPRRRRPTAQWLHAVRLLTVSELDSASFVRFVPKTFGYRCQQHGERSGDECPKALVDVLNHRVEKAVFCCAMHQTTNAAGGMNIRARSSLSQVFFSEPVESKRDEDQHEECEGEQTRVCNHGCRTQHVDTLRILLA